MSGASTAEAPPRAAAQALAATQALAPARTLVVGLGNPLLGDDGIGWRVVQAVEQATTTPGLSFDCLAVGGLALMERLVGTRRAILVDAVVTGADPPGTVRHLGLTALPAREASHLDSAHDVTLAAALAVGRAMGMPLPSEIEIVTIEAAAVSEFREDLTPGVEAAIPVAVATVLSLLAAG